MWQENVIHMDSGLNLTSEPGLQTPDTDCLLNCACSRSTNIYRASVTLRIGIKSWADENMGDISDFNLIIVWHEIQRKSYLIDTEECRIQACMGQWKKELLTTTGQKMKGRKKIFANHVPHSWVKPPSLQFHEA